MGIIEVLDQSRKSEKRIKKDKFVNQTSTQSKINISKD
jgi:hypothetical protein